MSKYTKPLTTKQIAALGDEDIDFSDIPELNETFWQQAELIEPDRTEQVTMRVKRSVLAHFKSSGKGYQTRMNRVLEGYVQAKRVMSGKIVAPELSSKVPEMPTKDDIDKVWDKAKKIRGEDADEVRQDPYGNKIRKEQFGGRGAQGWEIDHIKPESKGGSDHLRNLQALQTKKNRELGDSTRKRTRHKKA